MTGRRTFLHAGALALLAASLRAHAQRTGAMPRIAFLTPELNPIEPAFWQRMRDLGYVDGTTIVVDRRSAEGDIARLPALAAEIVSQRPDVIVAMVTQASIAATKATSTIPIVMIATSDPVASGIVANLARPEGNITGTAGQVHAIIGKVLDLIRELLPGAARLAVLWNPANAGFAQQQLSEAKAGAARLRLQLRQYEVRAPDALGPAFAAMAADRNEAVMVVADPVFVAHAGALANVALQRRLPVVGASRPYTEAGGLASYSPDLPELGRRSADYVDKVLKGARPASLPVELATKFELVINARTAKALGVVIPPPLLLRADEVIR